MEILQNLFRTLMFFLDNIVYGLIPQIYKIFIYLSELNLFGGESNPLKDLINHIYVLLGIFMLFKVSFSLLQYLVDPNSFRDSSKGMGKLVTNVLVALVLLVSVPTIFSAATELQKVIIHSNAIGQLILGTNATDYSGTVSDDGKIDTNGVETMAKDLQFMLFGAFYNLNTNISTFSACSGTSGVFGSVDMAKEDCLNVLNDEIAGYNDASSNGVTLYSFFKYEGSGDNCNSDGICDDRNFGHFDKLLWWKVDGEYVINYLPFISTAAGVYVVFLLISFSIDIAVRAIKLCFLQMIAPIAIVSYIDPNETIKEGKLSRWGQQCASTYFSLFLRLATIFLIMLLVSSITSTVLAGGEGSIKEQIDDTGYSIWIYLFLVIGAFMFAKQLPKIIENIFKLEGTGDLSLNPFKSIGEVITTPAIAAGGAAIGGAVGGMAANAIATGHNAWTNRKEIGQNISKIKNAQHMTTLNKFGAMTKMIGGGVVGAAGSIVAGGASAGVRGAQAGYKNKNILKGATVGRVEAVKARNDRDIRQDRNFDVGKRMGDKVISFAGVKNKSGGIGAVDQSIKADTRIRENVNAMEHATRDAQTQYVANSRFTRADFEKAVYNHDEKGQVVLNPNDNRPMMRNYNEYLSANNYVNPEVKDEKGNVISFDSSSGVLTEDEFNKFSTMEQDIRRFDDKSETLRKQISENQDLLDIQKKDKK